MSSVLMIQTSSRPVARVARTAKSSGGAHRNRLFICASTSLYSLYVNTQGAAGG